MVHFKVFVLLIFFAVPAQFFAQKNIVDQKDNSPISSAHILLDNEIYTYSNLKGEFEIAANKKFDTLKIVHLMYETKRLDFNDFQKSNIIPLKEKINILDEVIINSSKKKKRTQLLLPEKSMRDMLTEKRDIQILFESALSTERHVSDSETAEIGKVVYVPNEKRVENAVIKKIILNSISKQVKGDSVYIPFKVNLMTYDTIKEVPKEKIFKNDLTVGKKRGETVVIDLSKEDLITFPKEGICVVVSVYRTEYYLSNGYNPPRFHAVQIRKNSLFREYTNVTFSREWEEQMYSQMREQCFNFGVEIEYFE